MTVASCRDMRVESWGRIRVVSFPSEMWREESTLTRTGTARCQLKLRLTGPVIDATFVVAISIRSIVVPLSHRPRPFLGSTHMVRFLSFFSRFGFCVQAPHTNANLSMLVQTTVEQQRTGAAAAAARQWRPRNQQYQTCSSNPALTSVKKKILSWGVPRHP